MKFDSQEQEEEDEGLLEADTTHVDVNPFNVLVPSQKLSIHDQIAYLSGPYQEEYHCPLPKQHQQAEPEMRYHS